MFSSRTLPSSPEAVRDRGGLILLGLIFVFIALCAYLTPLFSNDYRYLMIEGTDERARTLYDIVISQYRHYFEWGGRTVNHVCAMLLLWLPHWLRALIQGLAFVSLIVLILMHATAGFKGARPLTGLKVLTVFALLWLTLRYFGEVVFNTVSSANYLYSTQWILLFTLPWRRALRLESDPRPWWFALLMFPLGVAVGWTNENSGSALAFVMGLYLLYLLFRRQVINVWQWTAVAGVGVGFLLLVLAPGNAARYADMAGRGFDYVAHLPVALEIYGVTWLLFTPLWLLLMLKLWTLRGAGLLTLKDPYLRGALFWTAFGVVSLTVMLASPTFPARSATFCSVGLILACMAVSESCEYHGLEVFPSLLRKLTLGVFVLYFAVTGSNTLQGYVQAHADGIAREREIASQLLEGRKDVTVEPFHVTSTKYLFIADIRSNPQHFANLILRRYYHIEGSLTRLCDPPSSYTLDFMLLSRVGERACQVAERPAQP